MATMNLIGPGALDNYQADSDLRCLASAEEIKGDKKRYKAALELAKSKIKDLQDLQEEADEEAAEPPDANDKK